MLGKIFTIGHGNCTLTGLVELVRGRGVTHLVDVRSSPFSKFQPDFCERTLEQKVPRLGVEYVQMGHQLGGKPPHADCYTEGTVDYGKIRQKDFFQKGLSRLQEAYNQGAVVCLLCAESDPSQCHRAKLLGRVLAEKGIDVVHLLADGTSRTQAEAIVTLPSPQESLDLK